MGFTYSCPVRWGDLDAQGHVNNGFYVDYLQEARVHFLLTGPPEARDLLDSGVLVVSHAVEYLRPVGAVDAVTIRLWVDDGRRQPVRGRLRPARRGAPGRSGPHRPGAVRPGRRTGCAG